MQDFERQAFQELLRLSIEQTADYVDQMGRLLNEEQGRFDRWVGEKTADLSEQENAKFKEWYADMAWDVHAAFPAFLWQSTLVSVYTFLEHELMAICKHYKREHNDPTPVERGRAKGIFAARQYLGSIGINIPAADAIWSDICRLNRVRNQLVHAHGYLDGSGRANQIEAYINRRAAAGRPGITIGSGNRIVITREYCNESLELVGNFFFNVLFPILN